MQAISSTWIAWNWQRSLQTPQPLHLSGFIPAMDSTVCSMGITRKAAGILNESNKDKRCGKFVTSMDG